MYRHYRDIPRLDDTAPMLARLHLQELHRQAARERLARSVAWERRATMARLSILVRSIWHALWFRIRKQPGATTVDLPVDQMAPETWVPRPGEAPLRGRRATESP